MGGEQFLCSINGRPQLRSASKDSHFTVLGFTAANGQPVMCAIIFAAKEMNDEWTLGLDPYVLLVGGEDDITSNAGRGKRYPMGPTCVFNGKTVPTFTGCSENGSVTGALLVAMLKKNRRIRDL